MAQDPDKTPVAQDLHTWCTREKTLTWHVVRNHNAQGYVERVICKACGSEHKYRSQKAAASSGSSSTRRVIVRSSTGAARSTATTGSSHSMEETWFTGIKKWGDKSVPHFDPQTHFNIGDVFEHTAFGKGVVQSRRENKIDVLFKTGLKTLPSR